MTDQELIEAIADKSDYEREFFVPVDSTQLHDAECCPIPPYVELLGRHDAEVLLGCLERIEVWKKSI